MNQFSVSTLGMTVLFVCDVMSEKVECHSGYDYADRPMAFSWNGQRLEVESILDRWRIPEGKCFRVKTTNQQVFEITYIEINDEWKIQRV